MEPANSVTLRFCLMKIIPSLLIHSLLIRAETPATMTLVIKRLVWSEASVVLVQMASWRRRQLLLTGTLKIPMPLTAPLCGVQRQVVSFLFSFSVFSKLFSILCFSAMHSLISFPPPYLMSPERKYCLVYKTFYLKQTLSQ